VALVQADVTQGLELRQRFDLVLANPPYVDAADMRTLPAEFAAEPVTALAAGEDGLSIMGPILEQLRDWLSEDGLFVGEVGGSARALVARYPSLPFIWLDLPHGGEGVFALEAAGLSSHTSPVF
jgi:ribosomal protein L3 glutamine methyltransferase